MHGHAVSNPHLPQPSPRQRAVGSRHAAARRRRHLDLDEGGYDLDAAHHEPAGLRRGPLAGTARRVVTVDRLGVPGRRGRRGGDHRGPGAPTVPEEPSAVRRSAVRPGGPVHVRRPRHAGRVHVGLQPLQRLHRAHLLAARRRWRRGRADATVPGHRTRAVGRLDDPQPVRLGDGRLAVLVSPSPRRILLAVSRPAQRADGPLRRSARRPRRPDAPRRRLHRDRGGRGSVARARGGGPVRRDEAGRDPQRGVHRADLRGRGRPVLPQGHQRTVARRPHRGATSPSTRPPPLELDPELRSWLEAGSGRSTFTQACRRGPRRSAKGPCTCPPRPPWRAPAPCPPASRSGCGSPSPHPRRPARRW